MTIESCRRTANAITNDLALKFPKADPQLLEAIRELTIKYMVPVIQAARKHSSGKSKSEKGSSKPNYYAFFHSVCSSKGGGLLWTVKDYDFYYQPDPERLKGNLKQTEIYDALQKDADRLERVKAFRATGDLPALMELVKKEFDVSQMTQTALIWNQFLSAHDHERFRLWYDQAINEYGEIPPAERPKIHVPATKVNARLRKRKYSELDPESGSDPEDMPAPAPVNEQEQTPETEQEPATTVIATTAPAQTPAPAPAPASKATKPKPKMAIGSKKTLLK